MAKWTHEPPSADLELTHRATLLPFSLKPQTPGSVLPTAQFLAVGLPTAAKAVGKDLSAFLIRNKSKLKKLCC